MTQQEKKQQLQDLAKKIHNCRRCPLYKEAKQAVPGEGDPDSKVMFVGEAPGYHEDMQGRPFVGPAGQLLGKLITLAGLSRREVFIANVIKHRPPNNRDPRDEEILACADWLNMQINIIDPKIIVTLGRFSMSKFVQGQSISRVHGLVFRADDRIIVPMYHPAAALRSTLVMQQIRQDFVNLQNLISREKDQKINHSQSQVDKKLDHEQQRLL
ncbi:uracil-DNA glycosylase [Candidatus Daviesbacteria bacterium]|nr:uracil-DNA glycosylase [Candidatus Daviesbacteria bacterium]